MTCNPMIGQQASTGKQHMKVQSKPSQLRGAQQVLASLKSWLPTSRYSMQPSCRTNCGMRQSCRTSCGIVHAPQIPRGGRQAAQLKESRHPLLAPHEAHCVVQQKWMWPLLLVHIWHLGFPSWSGGQPPQS